MNFHLILSKSTETIDVWYVFLVFEMKEERFLHIGDWRPSLQLYLSQSRLDFKIVCSCIIKWTGIPPGGRLSVNLLKCRVASLVEFVMLWQQQSWTRHRCHLLQYQQTTSFLKKKKVIKTNVIFNSGNYSNGNTVRRISMLSKSFGSKSYLYPALQYQFYLHQLHFWCLFPQGLFAVVRTDIFLFIY